MQGEATATLQAELSNMQKQTRVVADTLRTTLERLEEEISRGNQLEGALRRMDQRLTLRDRYAQFLLSSVYQARKQQCLLLTFKVLVHACCYSYCEFRLTSIGGCMSLL